MIILQNFKMRTKFTILFTVIGLTTIFAQSKYPDIPRIDIHTHAGTDLINIQKYLEIKDELKSKYSIDLAMWINLGGSKAPISNTDSILQMSQNRMLCTISDYDPFHGLKHKPENLKQLKKRGYVGYKIWYGPWYRRLEENEQGFRYVDDPANDAMFAEMERLGVLAASIHIADPNGPINNRTKWCADPVEYWKEITAFHNVLKKYPDLKVVAAHASWLICQDAQIDYLRFLLSKHPNLNIDLAATFQYFSLVSYENLRDFIIEYSDRILYGTDISIVQNEDDIKRRAEAYNRTFKILETDEMVEGSFFSHQPVKGLDLPQNILEKIYYRNAMRIYPRVESCMKRLGYQE